MPVYDRMIDVAAGATKSQPLEGWFPGTGVITRLSAKTTTAQSKGVVNLDIYGIAGQQDWIVTAQVLVPGRGLVPLDGTTTFNQSSQVVVQNIGPVPMTFQFQIIAP
jgi:hypothetical protein